MLEQNLFSQLFPFVRRDDQQDIPPIVPIAPSADNPQQDTPTSAVAALGLPRAPGVARQLDPSYQDAMPTASATDIPQDQNGAQASAAMAPPMETQARTAMGMQPLSPTTAPAPDSSPKKAKAEKNAKTFTPPHANPTTELERAENEAAYDEFQAKYGQNQDHGVKGVLKEILSNFLTGLSTAKPGMGLGESLALGGAGAGFGAINRGWNEQRAAQQALPADYRRVQGAQISQQRETQRQAQMADERYKDYQSKIGMAKAAVDQMNAQQKPFIDQWKGLDNFDPEKNPRDKAFADQAARVGVILTPKAKGDRFSTNIAPNGQIVVTNTGTGEYKVGGENVGKPVQYDEKDISPAEFGILTDHDIENNANSRVAPSIKDRQIRPDVLANLPPKYKNDDGSFNEQAYLHDANLGISKLNGSDLYQNLPDDYKQRVAQEIQRGKSAQGGLKKTYDRFLSVVNNRQVNPNSPPVTLDFVKQTFKQLLESKDKNAKEKLNQFFDLLQHANIAR